VSGGDERTLSVRGVEVPKIGFGTWQIIGRDCIEAVRDALDLGYRHLDTARVYENERDVGRGLSESGVPREDVFLSTKVWMDDLSAERLRSSLEGSLRDLGVDYVDLLLIHWPHPDVPVAEPIGEMERLAEEGKLRQLGVSNFPAGMLSEALEAGPVFCDQVEYHVNLEQERLLKLARERDVLIAAYAPFGHGEVLADPVLAEIGRARGRSPAQVALRWLVEQDHVCALPKAASHRNRVANIDVFDFELSDAERARLDAMPKGRRRFDTAWAPDWDA
jgi:2,5-diketo-D-gluconate reductase B